MTIDTDTFIAIGALVVSVLGLCFGFVKWTNSQLHGRITSVEKGINERCRQCKSDIRAEIATSFELIKEMVKEIRDDVRFLTRHSKVSNDEDKNV